MKRHAFVALLFAALASPVFGASSEMQPGLWEITTRVEMSGMPVPMPPQTIRHCYTKKDIEKGQGTVPQGDNKNCQIKDYKVRGNTASWTLVCTGKEAMTGAGTMTWTSTSYTGKMNARVKDGGETINMTHRWTAKRVGDCK